MFFYLTNPLMGDPCVFFSSAVVLAVIIRQYVYPLSIVYSWLTAITVITLLTLGESFRVIRGKIYKFIIDALHWDTMISAAHFR